MSSPMVVTIDGPAGAGKSTVAKALAKKLGIAFMDTGAMYRAMTVKALRAKVNLEDAEALVKLAHETHIDLIDEPGQPLRVLLDHEDVSEAIRSQEVTNNTFYIARTAGVREVMVKWQRLMGAKRSMVGDGRDLGTVVFPDARYKFYLDADFKVRCQRRIDELKAKGQKVDEEALSRDLAERDQHDFTRKVGPLKKADDAICVDSTGMSIDQVVDLMIQAILDKQAVSESWWPSSKKILLKIEKVVLDHAWILFALYFLLCWMVPFWRDAELSYEGRERYYWLCEWGKYFSFRGGSVISWCMVIGLLSAGWIKLRERSWFRGAVYLCMAGGVLWVSCQPVAEAKTRETLREYRERFPQLARENLGRISNRLEQYKGTKGVYPGSLDEVCDPALRPLCYNQSLWAGGPFKYELQSWGKGYKLRGAGWDTKLGTEDDIVW